jgi:FixJ family two-component response regulator
VINSCCDATESSNPLPGTWIVTSKLVLVVDDDLSTLNAIKRLLRQHGYNCHIFQSAEALEESDDFEQAFCIVLDINLNGSSGIELRRRLSEKGISLPVIYITGNFSETIRKEAISSGCIAYVTKPFGAEALIEPIRAATQNERAHGR